MTILESRLEASALNSSMWRHEIDRRRHCPARLPIGLSCPAISARPIVKRAIWGAPSTKAACFADSRSAHSTSLGRGGLAACAINRTATPSVITGPTGAVACFISTVASSTRPACASNDLATRRAIPSDVRTRSAATCQFFPGAWVLSRDKSALARVIIRAGCCCAVAALASFARSPPVDKLRTPPLGIHQFLLVEHKPGQ